MMQNKTVSSVEDLSELSSTSHLETLIPNTAVPVEPTLNISYSQFSPSESQSTCSSSKYHANITATNAPDSVPPTETTSLAAKQLTAGFLQHYAPPIAKAKHHLKELIQKQNKIYIDLSAEKFKLDNAEIAKLQELMNDVKIYREKLLKIKKQMQTIYQRTKVLKKRAINVQTCKEKELQRTLQKQQQEESLIGKQHQ